MLEESLKILKEIEEYNKKAYIVGGFVRDYILGIQSYDVDICTSATPRELKTIFKDAILPKEKYGSVTIYRKKIRYEITTFRIDSEYINNRTPVNVEYTNDLLVDLQRRDFTINAICMDSNGKIIDLLDSIKDVKAKIIKTIGDSNKKISDDALRILRAIRFSTVLNFSIDKELDFAIIKNKNLISNLSYYRKKEELYKIFSSKNIEKGIELLKKYNIFDELDITCSNIVFTKDIMGIWAQLNPSYRYQFSKNEKHELEALKYIIKKGNIDSNDIYIYGEYICLVAAEILGIDSEQIKQLEENMQIHNIKDIVISIPEIIKLLNIKDNSNIKIILKDLENKLVNNILKNDKESIINYLLKKY